MLQLNLFGEGHEARGPESASPSQVKRSHTITLSQEEVDILYFLCYNCVGGNLAGPRKHIDKVIAKLNKHVDSRRPALLSSRPSKVDDPVGAVVYLFPLPEPTECGKDPSETE